MPVPASEPKAAAATAAWHKLEADGWLSERSAALRNRLRARAKLRSYRSGESIYRAGDEPDGIFGLVSGALDISIPRSDGFDLTVHQAEPGFWVGDLALFAGQTRLVSVRADGKCRLMHVAQKDLRALVDAAPDYLEDFYALTYRNMRTALWLLGNLSISPSEIRLAWRLLQLDESRDTDGDWIRTSQARLAEMLAMSVPTLQRALRQLEQRRLVESKYRGVRIVDRSGLMDFCGSAESPGLAVVERKASRAPGADRPRSGRYAGRGA